MPLRRRRKSFAERHTLDARHTEKKRHGGVLVKRNTKHRGILAEKSHRFLLKPASELQSTARLKRAP